MCPGRPWTFWTEAHGADDWWPDIVFLSSPSDVLGDRDRTVVDLGREQWAEPEHVYLANRLVAELKYGRDPDQWTRPESTRVVAPPPSDPVRTPAPVAGVASGSIAARAAQVASVLRDPKDEPQLDSCMQQLELDARHNDFRQALRAALAGSDHGAPRIVELVAPSYVPDMFERLVIVLFGPELVDLETPSGVDQAARLVRDVDDDELVAVLARLTKTHGRLRRIAPALGMRWAERAGADAPEHGPVFAALAVVGRLFRVRSSTWQQRIFLTGWVLVLVLALGFGFFAGRTAAVPTVTAPLTPPPSAPPSAPERPREMTFGGSQVAGSFQNGSAEARGTVQNLPDGDQLRLLEGRTDQSGKIVYYLQPGPCAVADGAWLCRQSAPVPQAKRRDSSTVVVVHADPAVAAFAELDKNRKPDADAVRLEELPAGTATVVQQQP